MKEDLRQLWSQENKTQAKRFLKDWTRAEASGIKMLKSFAKTCGSSSRNPGLLQLPNLDRPLEGTNNKIKTMKREAYGDRERIQHSRSSPLTSKSTR